MPVARIVGGIGRVLVTVGLLLLLFVAYQLWGTGLAEAQAQDELRDEFEASLAAAPTTSTTSATSTTSTTSTTAGGLAATTTTTTTTTTAAPAPEPRPAVVAGEALAILRIPAIDLDKTVVEGVSVGDLKKGPGHYPATALPGQAGNTAIAGHRTTYGAPFGDLGELQDGDEILVTTRDGEFRYVVDRISVVSPEQVEVLHQTDEARITLTTCHPKYSARQRLIVSGVLAAEPVATPPAAAPTAEPGPDEPAPDEPVGTPEAAAEDEPTVPPEEDEPAEEDEEDDPVVAAPAASLDDPSLAGDPSALGPAAAWAAATALVALAAWLVGRRWRRLPAYALALPLGTVTLFLCFEQIARLLPSSI